jgi:mono/diheme cytochrome c family protein
VRALVLAVCAAAVIAAGIYPEADARKDPGWAGGPGDAALGATLYDRFCLACHGADGKGAGPAAPWLWPRPRDLTRGEFKWRSTASGQPPTAEDVVTTITHGVPGTSMHGFGAALDGPAVFALVARVRAFAPDKLARAALPVPVAQAPAVDDALIARGAEAYATYGCTQCHGPALAGDGASAASLRDSEGRPAPPYDLTRLPLRRPRDGAGARNESAIEDIYLSLITGLDGTPMPSYASLPAADLWALAAFIDSKRWRPERGPALPDPTLVDPIAIQLDKDGKLAESGAWPGHGAAEEAIFPRTPLPPQGVPPASLAPAQASLPARRCGRCHAEQYERWKGSVHAQSVTEGLYGQLRENAGKPDFAAACQKCHAPLAEQRTGQPGFDGELQREGVTCAGCHLRAWTRHGPPRSPGSKLLALPGYPMEEMGFYERADFCLPCHQLSPRVAVSGKPLLNTYREWLEGPYMRRGVQCQHCHMPSRRHEMTGVHDAETFRKAIQVEGIAGRSARTGAVSVRARLRNVGAGHYLPTTPTPAAFMEIELLDAFLQPIAGARAEKRIGRKIKAVGKTFRELEDTRVPPGDSVELAAAWTGGRVPKAVAARVTVRVHPQDFYEGFYEARLRRTDLDSITRMLYKRARQNAFATRYQATSMLIPIAQPK